MRCLVTGGAGFIGSHLCEALVKLGCEVTALDDLSTGRRENVAALEGRPGFRLAIGSVLDEALTDGLAAAHDRIFHLAGTVGVRLVVEQPVRAMETIAAGAATVLRCASRHGRKALLASSSEVYGKSSAAPFREDSEIVLGCPRIGRWSYGCAKALAEFLAFGYVREKRLPAVIARLFNTVGPRQTGLYGMVLPRFVEQALRGNPIEVHGDGLQTRCFAHVGDVVGGIVGLMECPAAEGEIVNLGSDEEITILDLARRVAAVTGSRSEIRCVPYRQVYGDDFEDMRRRAPCLEKARRLIGYKATRGIEAIIEDVARSTR